ncbi:MAG: GNAT family N-acetyltransferase [Candidatus Bathyarchaeota archaeon]|nr:GNAT family N-acetyltransferase [Candidatus Bathyarchaeota archaeon]
MLFQVHRYVDAGEKLHIRKVTSTDLIRACRRYLAQDPVSNVLPLGDLYSPLFEVSDVYFAVETARVVGVCAIYRAFLKPSVVLGAAVQDVKEALAKKAIGEISDEFVSLCPPEEVDLYKDYSTILRQHREQQMVANPPRQIDCGGINVEKVKENELELLSEFYEPRTEVWGHIQFRAGPYYCVKRDGKIVSAAGVHLVTPQIAQLGNIITDEAYRNQGFATACTNALVTDLASKGRIISLFVRADNEPAIHVYKKLGFHKVRDISFLVLHKNK